MVAVTVACQPLARALGAGITDPGQRVSAATMGRLACDARIVPVVLGSAGQILDAGRAGRLGYRPVTPCPAPRDGAGAAPD
ncbi:DUF222 domain-containing protein [Actinoplanes sp. TBRC 11911]|uniref:DUF222 domain-containing protein n=1 Tax=Actinoplanes sp. TBRC 11911 TaxID=2729386 RepID=UPI00145E70A6|nr:DUF222 domain-containing protein [Actinoplanes sp. TBRC 11911]NMO56977.1 DUF222 domain-containing protein [Actinoplanes sp. TBRC 11911]